MQLKKIEGKVTCPGCGAEVNFYLIPPLSPKLKWEKPVLKDFGEIGAKGASPEMGNSDFFTS